MSRAWGPTYRANTDDEAHHFDTATVTIITVILNVGAIVGSLFVASFSQQFGRRRVMIAAALAALPRWRWALL